MSKAKIGVLTPSYNKPQYVLDCIKSVVNQTYTDWIYKIVDNSTDDGTTRTVIRLFLSTLTPEIRNKIEYVEEDYDEEFRKATYVPSYIANRDFKAIDSEYIFYISDDDVLEPRCFEELIKHFNKHPEHDVCYFRMGLKAPGEDGEFKIVGDLPAMGLWGKIFGQEAQPLNMMDGGQILVSKRALNIFKGKFFYETTKTATACHCDGLFLVILSKHFKIYPIECPDLLGHHRITKISTWRKA